MPHDEFALTSPSNEAPPSAGTIEAALLLMGSCLPVLAAVLVAPVLPRIQAHYADVPHVELLVPVMLTVPALVVGLLAPFAGLIVDRLGRLRLLLAALVLYTVAGTAPLWLQSLHMIIASRVLVGFAEAAIMTCCTTLIGDYYHGARRERLLAMQTVVASISATAFFIIGGILGESNWRTPFWLYGAGLLLLPLMAWRLREPLASNFGSPTGRAATPFPWRRIGAICAITLFTAIAFYLLPVHLGFILDAMGEQSPQRIGQAIGIGSVATVIGASLYGPLSRLGVAHHLLIAFLCSGIGFLALVGAGSYVGVVVAVVINSLGSGMALPALLNWAMRQLSFEQRGRGMGIWTASFFVGQFVCPVIVLLVGAATGGMLGAVGAAGWALLAMASVALVAGFRSFRRQPPAVVSHDA